MADTDPHANCEHCGLPVPPARRTDPQAARFCCVGCRLVHRIVRAGKAAPSSPDNAAINPLLLRLGVGIFLTMNIMVFNDFFLSRYVFTADIPASQQQDYRMLAGLFSYLIMFLATVVMVVLGIPIARDALAGIVSPRGIRIDTSLLITLGVAAAYMLSVLHTLRGEGPLYFDTAAMILVLVTLGSLLESGAKLRAARDAMAFFDAIPTTASIHRDGHATRVPVSDVRPDDRVLVCPGETIPVDGRVVLGRAHIDESSLTGESQPRPVATGDTVLAGSLSIDGMIHVTATSTGDNRTIARMRELLDRARAEQPPVQRLADRLAAVFVPAVVVLAVGMFIWQWKIGNSSAGLMTALSILLISCPCALGLSAPLATWSALGRAARRGILIGSGAVLERAAQVRHVFFDKTGTLTTADMRLTSIATEPGVTSMEALALAAAAESGSSHPVARAFLAAANNQNIHPPAPSSLIVLPGVGIEANVSGRILRIGTADILPAARISHAPAEADHRVYLVEADRLLAIFMLDEHVRDDAKRCMTQLAALGITAEVLTGDQAAPAQALSRALNVQTHACMLPADKLDRLSAWRTAHASHAVAMIGDGINDAPALAAADVGIAIGGGTDLARQAGNIHLISDRLARVPELFALARHAHRRIRLSLAWAFGYNIVGIALACTGRLSPIFAASAMVLSSLIVVWIAHGAGRLNDEQDITPDVTKPRPSQHLTKPAGEAALATE